MAASPYVPAAEAAAAKYGIPAQLLLRQVNEESGWRPDARSPAGAMGLLQLMPGTARGLGVKNPFDPVENLNAGAHYLREQYDRFGNWRDALAAYNAGPGNVVDGRWKSIPETTRYVDSILSGLGVESSPAPAHGPTSAPRAPSAPSSPDFSQPDLNLLMTIIGGGSPSAGQLLASAAPAASPAVAATPAMESPQPAAGHFKVGDPVVGGTSIGGLHQTEGLPGYPAHDYFAPSGSRVVAPVTGRVIKLSGHDPSQGPVEGPHGPLGWSVYIQGGDGRIYFLTHLGSRSVHLGQTIRAGAPIGTVADYAKYGTPSHIHMGVHA